MTNQSKQVILGLGKANLSDEMVEAFRKRCQAGTVYAEYGYPRKERGSTPEEYLRRFSEINLSKVCLQIRDVSRSACGGYLVGDVVPFGSYKELVQSYFEGNPATQLQLGLRSIKNAKGEHTLIITYDVVNIKH